MNRLKFPQKFLLIAVLFLTIILTISVIYFNDVKKDTDLIAERTAGAEYNLILKEVLKYAQQHRGTAVSAFTGDEASIATLHEIEKSVDEAMANMSQFEETLTYDFETKNLIKEIDVMWNNIVQTENWATAAEIVAIHTDLTNKIMETMREVNNESNLQLALSSESNSLITTVTKTMPDLTESLGILRANILTILKTGEMTEAQSRTLNQHYYLIQQDRKTIDYDLINAFQSEDLKQVIEPVYATTEQNIDLYLSEIEKVLLNQDFSSNPDEFFAIATAGINNGFDLYEESLTYIINLINTQSDDQIQKRNMIFIIEIIVLIIVAFLFIGFYLGVKQSITRMSFVTKAVANGDLTVQASFDTKDEMKEIEVAFNEMTKQLNEIVKQISNSAEYVAAASEELHASVDESTKSIIHVTNSVEDMADGSKSQVKAIQHSTEQLNQMSDGVNEIAHNTQTVYELAGNTTAAAQDGSKTVTTSTNQMHSIQSSVEKTSSTIMSLNERTSEIGNILNIITNIAEQTNLLSLNAAIEAARAGEHGKGFAVVANEVGNLATQSRESVKQVAALIKAIQQDTETSVNMMSQVTTDVEKGLVLSDETASKFQHIVDGMQTLELRIQNISASSDQLASNTTIVVKSMEEMMSVSEEFTMNAQEIASSTEEQNASMEEMSSAAVELAQMAEKLQGLVNNFKI
jgi:methyl-accepting chemotaxis protein